MTEPKSKRRKTNSDSKKSKSKEISLKELEERFACGFSEDIIKVWAWATETHTKDPLNCLKNLLGLTLLGPFRFLENRDKYSETAVLDLHMIDREWQTPPEFQPCVASPTTTYGFWRDVPEEAPVFTVQKEDGNGVITQSATDLIDLIRVIAKKKKVKVPDTLSELIENYTSSSTLKQIAAKRRKSVVAKTLNKIGICVPVVNDIGYRPITISYHELDRMLTKSCMTEDEDAKDRILAPMDECVNYIQFANDECDYGMGFELGMCVFSHGASRNFIGTISSLLPLAYQLLGRKMFGEIVQKMCDHVDKEAEGA